ncbi:amidohydrolase family protein [Devosia sp. FJ2-5-3]|uniref:amidohydrolase family protein n=1 Tax=Devosia sp. FJ2-5-3 TaxID=2976680 RepID=UPI0023D89C53|nr:amidohydrolase family protein [Devosia sp. FJ2-5-3]WEJ58791.1 amidohydrolase family protein [Devosia sp. FJ2-5-3]
MADTYQFDPSTTQDGYGAIDIVVNFYTPQVIAEKRVPTDENFRDQVRMADDHRRGLTPEQYIEKMDRAGIERSLLIAARCGDRRMSTSTEIPYEYVHEAVQKYPHRYSGVAGINPLLGIAGLKELDYAVNELGFVGAHLYPHWFGQAPDAAIYYPYYARCAELGIPIMMQVGHCLVYRTDNRLATVAKPMMLDRIAIDFPELTIIGIHLGYPWTEEMISVATKHKNVYMAGDAYAPKHWGASAVHFANTFGQDKFLFGTDWWVIDPERAVKEVDELNFRPHSKRKVMRDNALKVFNLPGDVA